MRHTIKHRNRDAWVKDSTKGPNDPARYGMEENAEVFCSREKATIEARGFEEVTLSPIDALTEIAKVVALVVVFGGIAFLLMV